MERPQVGDTKALETCYQNRNGFSHQKPGKTPSNLNLMILLTYHSPRKGSSVSILQIMKLRPREVSHCLRPLSLQP